MIADGLARGLREAAKALDKRQALLCILAENCDEPMYKKLVTALCQVGINTAFSFLGYSFSKAPPWLFYAPAVVSRSRATSFWVWCQSLHRLHLNQILTLSFYFLTLYFLGVHNIEELHLQEHGIPLIKVDSNMKLGEWAGLCKIDQEGKARKVVKCSAAVVSLKSSKLRESASKSKT